MSLTGKGSGIAQSLLTQPTQANNFIALQSVQLPVTNASGKTTFTDLPGTQRLTAKITNSGTTGCYLASGTGGNATAVTSSTTVLPAYSVGVVANCDYIAAGSIITQDYQQGTDTFAAICAGSGTTTLEISVGYGQ